MRYVTYNTLLCSLMFFSCYYYFIVWETVSLTSIAQMKIKIMSLIQQSSIRGNKSSADIQNESIINTPLLMYAEITIPVIENWNKYSIALCINICKIDILFKVIFIRHKRKVKRSCINLSINIFFILRKHRYSLAIVYIYWI